MCPFQFPQRLPELLTWNASVSLPEKLSLDTVAHRLGTLPPAKGHCEIHVWFSISLNTHPFNVLCLLPSSMRLQWRETCPVQLGYIVPLPHTTHRTSQAARTQQIAG